MEPYVKEQFTKAIAMCGYNPDYENIKDFMQDMISDNIALAAKDTPIHLLKFIQNAAYNKVFSDEFCECMQNVLFERKIEDNATMFHIRKLRNAYIYKSSMLKLKDEQICGLDIEQSQKDERIKDLEKLVDELERRVEILRTINNALNEKVEEASSL